MNRTGAIYRRLATVAASLCRPGRRGDAAAAAAGLALVFAFAPFGIYPLAPLTLAALLALIGPLSWRQAAWRGFLFGFAEFAFGVYWIYNSLHGMGGVAAPIAVLMLLMLVAIMALYSAAACALAVRLAPRDGWRRRLLLFPGLWVLLEWVRSWFLSGFPWLTLGYSEADGALRGYAPLLGVFGLSLLLVLSAGLLLELPGGTRRKRGLALAGIVALWLTGALLARVQWVQPAGAPVHVSLIQGDIAQEQKWEPEFFKPTLDLYRGLTEKHWDRSKLVIWPEAAVPAYEDEVRLSYLDPLDADARKHGVSILLGIPTYDPADDYYFNSVIGAGMADGRYNKRHLVPFGENFEFLPRWVRSLLRSMDLPYSSFNPGAVDQPLPTAAGYPVGVSICYEDAFGSEILRTLPQAAFLVNVSNDGWFGRSIALPQHLEIARMRAIETGRWLLRATNTGITAIVDGGGRVTAEAPVGEVSVLEGDMQPVAGATPVSRWGDGATLLLGLLFSLAGLWPLLLQAVRR